MVGTLLLIVVVVIEHVVIPSLSLAAAVIVKVIVGLRLCLSSEDVKKAMCSFSRAFKP